MSSSTENYAIENKITPDNPQGMLEASLQGFETTFFVGMCVAVLALVVALFMKKDNSKVPNSK